jgi:hypothetical protein
MTVASLKEFLGAKAHGGYTPGYTPRSAIPVRARVFMDHNARILRGGKKVREGPMMTRTQHGGVETVATKDDIDGQRRCRPSLPSSEVKTSLSMPSDCACEIVMRLRP